MKILIYSANYFPEQTGIGKYSGEMAQWLAARGHDVRVVAAPPYYPQWKVAPGYGWPYFRRESIAGVDVWRAPLWVPGNPGGLKRVLHLLSFALTSLPLALWQIAWGPNVVWVVAPAIVCAPSGWLVARLSGARAWLHVQDFEVDVAFKMGLLHGGWSRRIVSWAEQRLLRRFDVVSSISDRMVARLHRKGVLPDKVRFFPNWVDVGHVQPLSRTSEYRAELGISDEAVVVLFSGALGNKQGLMVIPEAAALLRDRDDIIFVIGGEGVMKRQLEQVSSQLPNVRLLPLQPSERLSEWLGLADIHLLPQSPEAEDLVLPSKLSGMLSSGRPIVATCRPGTEIAKVVAQCGLTVEPEDASNLAKAITTLADSREERKRLGQAARTYAEEHLAQSSVLTNFEQDCERLLAEAGVSSAGR